MVKMDIYSIINFCNELYTLMKNVSKFYKFISKDFINKKYYSFGTFFAFVYA